MRKRLGNSFFNSRTGTATVWLTGLIVYLNPIAGAASNNVDTGTVPPRTAPNTQPVTQRSQGDERFASSKIESVPQMPGMPTFTGRAKLLSGLIYKNSLHGPSYALQFEADERPEQVYSWYRQSLANYGWNLRRATNTLLQAVHKDGHRCVIRIAPAFEKNNTTANKTKISLYFHEFQHP